ncbi:beta-1,4-glucuronyltransferase 1 [Lingula anatina]|uniref:Beta-1,4-glucuronyltransferase 1 n=1 Tax=Lingula anatina TaxID=7574 RepID=A0A1S3HI36_LINAN|nr:beta-1,4-glucuronyltransferase 1 [Lingula anatina]XP_013385683.1 beta-1,4-glucuronyltransferase 1 [Lingula anatina]|eukprot:XP_013385682.1 beta-1,4-glucuronyltransferase 1 [Lingula anatina]
MLANVTWGRVATALVLLLAGLQVFHLLLLSQLQERADREKAALLTRQQEHFYQESGETLNTMLDKLREKKVIDSWGSYYLVNNWIKGTITIPAKQGKNLVTLVTQCSVDHLYNVVEMVEKWQGPISLSVFAPGQDAIYAIEVILLLRYCVTLVAQYVTFHLVRPISAQETNLPLSVNLTINMPNKHVCDNIELSLKKILRFDRTNYDTKDIPYPNNLLRNVALRNSVTGYVLVIDIDLRTSDNLFEDFRDFIATNRIIVEDPKTLETMLYVVPAFEVESNQTIPSIKSQLVNLWDKGIVRPFYEEVCPRCHKYTQYHAWKILQKSSKLEMSFQVEWRDPWEPFVIAPKTIPYYDERFKQYGFNRISQACELHIAGYSFNVLNNAFVVHKGFKTTDVFHKTKQEDMKKNKLLFRQFKEDMKTKYRDSPRKCH